MLKNYPSRNNPPTPSFQKNEENALHLAIGLESTTDGSALHLIDFLIQNKDQPSDARFNFAPRTHGLNVLDRPDGKGNTPLHLCASLNRTEGMSERRGHRLKFGQWIEGREKGRSVDSSIWLDNQYLEFPIRHPIHDQASNVRVFTSLGFCPTLSID